MARPYWAGDLSNAEWSNCCRWPVDRRRSRPQNKSAGLPSPTVPADILSGGVPPLICQQSKHNGFGPREVWRGLAQRPSPRLSLIDFWFTKQDGKYQEARTEMELISAPRWWAEIGGNSEQADYMLPQVVDAEAIQITVPLVLGAPLDPPELEAVITPKSEPKTRIPKNDCNCDNRNRHRLSPN